jgi:hypothetical protein
LPAPYRSGTINATCHAWFTLRNRRSEPLAAPNCGTFIPHDGCCGIESAEAPMESDYASPLEESCDFDEASARLQSGLIQCQRMVADYRALLSGDYDEPASFDQPV